jgi:hypothetical protein
MRNRIRQTHSIQARLRQHCCFASTPPLVPMSRTRSPSRFECSLAGSSSLNWIGAPSKSKTGDAESVDIEITRKAEGSRSRADRTHHDHVVTATQTDNTVKVQAEYKGARSRSWFSLSPKLRINCRIAIPRKFDVDLKTAGGHIQVAELTGKVQAHTSGGTPSARTGWGCVPCPERC